MLSFPIQLLPLAVNFTGQALISLRRITKFLALEEMEEDTTIYNKFAGTKLFQCFDSVSDYIVETMLLYH